MNAPWRNGDTWADVLLVQGCSGCRPAELLAGVHVQVEEEGGAVRIRVAGAKTGEDGVRGQPWREVVVRPGAGANLVDALIRYAQEEGGAMTVRIRHESADPVDAYCSNVRRLANRLGYHGVSAYTVRHQFAADAKADGVSIERLAQALGHTTPRAQQIYGLHALGGTGMIKLESAASARPIRDLEDIDAPEEESGVRDDNDETPEGPE